MSLGAGALLRSGLLCCLLALACSGGRELPVPPEDLASWSARAEQVRGLRFERPVELVRITPERIPELMRGEISREFSPEEARAYAAAYAALGLFPPGVDLFPLLVDLYGQQLAGLYEPREERLYVRDGAQPGGYGTEIVAVHELVHALQHQHFPKTIGVQLGLRHNDDLSTMLAAVVEGDASLASFALSPTHGRDPAKLAPVRDAMMQQVEDGSGGYERAPRPLRLRLVVPYADGLLMAARVFSAGGNAALDDWVSDPPLSTLGLVDPNAPQRPVEFVRLPLEWLQDQLEARSCKLGHHDVVGPLMISALFHDRNVGEGDAIATGWSGDRLLHATCQRGSELLWVTRWSTAQDAARFAAAYLDLVPRIAKGVGLTGEPRVSISDRTVLVRTPRFVELGAQLEAKLEVRSYAHFREWLGDGCFPETSCKD